MRADRRGARLLDGGMRSRVLADAAAAAAPGAGERLRGAHDRHLALRGEHVPCGGERLRRDAARWLGEDVERQPRAFPPPRGLRARGKHPVHVPAVRASRTERGAGDGGRRRGPAPRAARRLRPRVRAGDRVHEPGRARPRVRHRARGSASVSGFRIDRRLAALCLALVASATAAEAQLTMRVRVPAGTADTAGVYVAGSFNGWNPANPAYRLTRDGDGEYSIILPAD